MLDVQETTKTELEIETASNDLVKQIAQWDDVEGCWEVFVPFPSKIEIAFDGNIHDWFEVVMLVHDFFDKQEGISYSLSGGFGDGKVIIEGIHWS